MSSPAATQTYAADEPACTWTGHCLGDPCTTYDDCDHDWVCSPEQQVCVPCCLTVTDTALPTSASTTAPSSSATSAASGDGDSSGLSTGAWVGIAIAAAAVVLFIVGFLFFCFRIRPRRRERKLRALAAGSTDEKAGHGAVELPNSPPAPPPPQEMPVEEQRSEVANTPAPVYEMPDTGVLSSEKKASVYETEAGRVPSPRERPRWTEVRPTPAGTDYADDTGAGSGSTDADWALQHSSRPAPPRPEGDRPYNNNSPAISLTGLSAPDASPNAVSGVSPPSSETGTNSWGGIRGSPAPARGPSPLTPGYGGRQDYGWAEPQQGGQVGYYDSRDTGDSGRRSDRVEYR
ncbi:hypothetical protein BDY21DRAFT_214103 [Lineolata rhizophorae]|uniref:Membrane anchor Opy2 N-terminal domain-containing protein n=1 Tax=Lineolata rhizophorae TaxID=578093 RepID=A0A6A6P337_9PEZI|nr:hypothetical protein BDY21DRAFT_214103 [Lineolata rhizophorae]